MDVQHKRSYFRHIYVPYMTIVLGSGEWNTTIHWNVCRWMRYVNSWEFINTLQMTSWLVKLVGLVAMLATSWQHYVSGIVSLIYRCSELPLEFVWGLSQCDKVNLWSCNTRNIFINLDMLEKFDPIEHCDLQICYKKLKFIESKKWNVRRTSKPKLRYYNVFKSDLEI